MADKILLRVPGHTIKAEADPFTDVQPVEAFPGILVSVDDKLAAVVEWHPDHQAIVVRTYTDKDDDPRHYHTWNGEELNRR